MNIDNKFKDCIIIEDPVPTPKKINEFKKWCKILKHRRIKDAPTIIITSRLYQEDEIHKFIETREEKDDKKTNA